MTQKKELLKDLFKATQSEPSGVSRRLFLAKHPNDIEEVERLVEVGQIKYRDGKYLRLPLLGLIELASVLPDAESMRYLCSHLFDVLRASFIENPDEKFSVREIAILADMPNKRVEIAFGFLLDAPIFESLSTYPNGSHFDIVLSDRILKYQTFNDLVGAMHQQIQKLQHSGVAQKDGNGEVTGAQGMALAHSYVDPARLSKLNSLLNKKWDPTRLVRMCEELNEAFERDAFITCSMLVRSIVDHIPPIFGYKSFSEVANNYSCSKSFRKSMQQLDNSLRNHADANLHTQIRRKESLPTRTQVAFWSDLDKLLEEVVRVLEDDENQR